MTEVWHAQELWFNARRISGGDYLPHLLHLEISSLAKEKRNAHHFLLTSAKARSMTFASLYAMKLAWLMEANSCHTACLKHHVGRIILAIQCKSKDARPVSTDRGCLEESGNRVNFISGWTSSAHFRSVRRVSLWDAVSDWILECFLSDHAVQSPYSDLPLQKHVKDNRMTGDTK